MWTVCLRLTRHCRSCDLNPGPSAPESSMLTTRLPSHSDRNGVCAIHAQTFCRRRVNEDSWTGIGFKIVEMSLKLKWRWWWQLMREFTAHLNVCRFIYETEQFNGIGELLEILGRSASVFNVTLLRQTWVATVWLVITRITASTQIISSYLPGTPI